MEQEKDHASGAVATGGKGIASRAAGVLLATVAMLVLALAWPRLHASLAFLPVDTALERYFDNREMSAGQARALAAQARRAIGYHDHYRYWQALGVLHYLAAGDPDTPRWERLPEVRRAQHAALETVRRAPVNPYAWLQLAQTRSILGAQDEAVWAAWELSVLTGRVEPELLLPRLALAFDHLPGLPPDQRSLLADQAALAWRLKPGQLLRAVSDGSLPRQSLLELLSVYHPDAAAGLQRNLDGSA